MDNTAPSALAGKWWWNCANLLLVWYPGHATQMSCHIYEWVMSHVQMSHLPCMNKPCLAYDASCHIQKWVTSYVWMICCTHEWASVLSRFSMIHAAHVSLHNHKSVMPHMRMSLVPCINKHVLYMTHHVTHKNQSFQWCETSVVSNMYTDIFRSTCVVIMHVTLR